MSVSRPSQPVKTGGSIVWLPIFYIMLQNTLYGFGDPISKVAYEVLPVYSLLTVRYSIALIFMLALFGKRVLRGLRECSWRDWMLPSLCMAGAHVCGNIAIEMTAATSVAFLRSLSTVMTPLLALVLFRKPLGRKHIPILCLVVLGLYLLCGLGGLSGFGSGEVFSLITALLLAGTLVFGEQSMKKIDIFTLSAVQTTVSVAMALICALIFEHGIHMEAATKIHWAIILYLALTCTLAGYLLQNAALGIAPSRTVALLQCICPVMTALFSFLILKERLSAAGMIGAVILLACVTAETMMTDGEAEESD